MNRLTGMRRRRVVVLSALGLTVSLTAAGCGGGTSADGAKTGSQKTAVIAMAQGSLRTLDPNSGYEPEWYVIGHQIYQTLVTFSGSDVTKVTPSLAKSWTASPDSKTYTLTMDPRAKFADGSQVTAADAAFALLRFKNTRGPGAWLLDNLATAEATKPDTLVLTLKAPDVSFLTILTSPSLTVGRAAAIKEHGGTDAEDADTKDKAQHWLNTTSVGSGPYVLKSWINNTELTLERNPNYWGTAPAASRVVFKFVADSNSQLQMVRRGDAAIAMDLTPDQVAGLKGSADVSVARTPALGVTYLGWTASAQQDPYLSKPANWTAIRNALDYKGIVELARGAGVRAGGIVPAALAGGLTPGDAPVEDLAKARAALAEAGNPNGFPFKLTYASQSTAAGVPFDPVAQKIQTDLARVGIKVELHPELQVQFYADYRGGKLPAALHWWLADYADALNFLPVFVPPGSVAVKRQHWSAEAADPALVQMAAKSLVTKDDAARANVVSDAQKLLNTSGPYAPLVDVQRQIVFSTKVLSSVDTNPVWVVDLAGTRLK